MVTAAVGLRQHLVRAGTASVWVVIGRVLGFAWTLLLTTRLGIGEYGTYAIGFAIAAIVAAPIDNLFYVRALRIENAPFLRERTTRAIVGGVILLLGIAAFVPMFVIGFGLIIAGGEILFNSYKSAALRDGHPQRTMRLDAIRQASSIVLAGVYVFAVPHPQLMPAVALYVLPYLVVAVLATVRAIGHRPALGGRPRELTMLFLDALGLSLYIQGDVLVLGLVASNAETGLYSIASQIGLAAASIGQVFMQTYNERLRLAHGDPAAGPRRPVWIGLSALLGIGVLVLAGILAIILPGQPIVGVLAIMSAFGALRSGTIMLTSFLYVQRQDVQRVLAGGVASIVKLGLIAAVGSVLGAFGAAGAAVLVEAMMFIWFYRAAYTWKRSATDAAEGEPEMPPVMPGDPLPPEGAV